MSAIEEGGRLTVYGVNIVAPKDKAAAPRGPRLYMNEAGQFWIEERNDITDEEFQLMFARLAAARASLTGDPRDQQPETD